MTVRSGSVVPYSARRQRGEAGDVIVISPLKEALFCALKVWHLPSERRWSVPSKRRCFVSLHRGLLLALVRTRICSHPKRKSTCSPLLKEDLLALHLHVQKTPGRDGVGYYYDLPSMTRCSVRKEAWRYFVPLQRGPLLAL